MEGGGGEERILVACWWSDGRPASKLLLAGCTWDWRGDTQEEGIVRGMGMKRAESA